MEDIVIVGVDNTDARMFEYTYSKDPSQPGGGGANLYLDFLERTVLPLAATQFRLIGATAADGLDIGMMGSSLGGLVSCYAGWTRPTTFRRLGCMSPSFWWNNQDFNQTILPATGPVLPPLSTESLFYLDSGDTGTGEQEIEQDTLIVRQHLESLGFQIDQNLFYYLGQGGQHNEASWGERVHVPLQLLYGTQ
jgi:predicted alpha/beta superfamily hydrolase